MSLAERFHLLYAGLDRAHGQFILDDKDPDTGKQKGTATTQIGGPTVELWQRHLDGEVGLGVVPITDDATCQWGAIDIDTYPLDLRELEDKIAAHNLPLTILQTKSGGAHVTLFLSEPAPADLVRLRLMEWCVLLGYPPSIEIFPKQARLGSEDDTGNWLNMPYFGGTSRRAWVGGRFLDADEFIEHATSVQVSLETLNGWLNTDALFSDGPPCLEAIMRAGPVPEGSRNEILFNAAVYYNMQDALDSVLDFNAEHLDPPLPDKEVATVVKSVSRKEYFYKCKSPLLSNYCNRELCRKRQHGIASGGSMTLPAIDHLTKIISDEPIWWVNVDGNRVELMNVDDLNYFRRFKRAVMTQTSLFVPDVPHEDWQQIVSDLYKKLEEHVAPSDASFVGQFHQLLDDFLTRRQIGNSPEDLMRGLAFIEGDKIYFRAEDLRAFLSDKKFHFPSMTWVYSRLADIGATQKKWKIHGKSFRTWGTDVPENVQNEDFDTPEFEEDDF